MLKISPFLFQLFIFFIQQDGDYYGSFNFIEFILSESQETRFPGCLQKADESILDKVFYVGE